MTTTYNSNLSAVEACRYVLDDATIQRYPFLEQWAESHDALESTEFAGCRGAEIDTIMEELRDHYIGDDAARLDDEYREFFFACFSALPKTYPAPSVTEDYDKQVIFDAIAKGGACDE